MWEMRAEKYPICLVSWPARRLTSAMYGGTRHIYPTAIDAVSRGVINLKDINPTVFPFERSQEAFEFAFEHRSEVLKTVIKIF